MSADSDDSDAIARMSPEERKLYDSLALPNDNPRLIRAARLLRGIIGSITNPSVRTYINAAIDEIEAFRRGQ